MKQLIRTIQIILLLTLMLARVPGPMLAQTEITCGTDVLVQADDELSKIAAKFYDDLLAFPAIVEATNAKAAVDSSYATIEDADRIEPGWKLCLPSKAEALSLASRNFADLPEGEDPSGPAETEKPYLRGAACQGSAFNPNPIASSKDPRILEQLHVLADQEDEEVLSGLVSLDEGILHSRWVSLVSDNAQPYLRGAACDELMFGWQDPRFSFVTAYVGLERAIRWLSSIHLVDSLPRDLRVRISETQPVSRYDAKNRELSIGSRQCEELPCACNPARVPCPQSTDGRPIWPHAQDADIVVHEYGHAVLHHLVCGDSVGCVLPTGQTVTALDEGFADYLASAVNQSSSRQKNDPFCFGEWFNSFQRYQGPCLRRLDSDLHWPETARALREALPYGYSSIWASALFKARKAIPEASMDRIVFDAYAGLEQEMSFEQMATRLVDAASRIDGGQHEATIRSFLRQQGFLNDLAPPAAISGNMLNREIALELSSWELSAFPAFDHKSEITVSGALAIQLQFDRIRLKAGDCFEASCGHLYVGDASGQIYEVIEGVHNDYVSVIVPGETVVLRFVASFDHPRTTIYRVTGLGVWPAGSEPTSH
jgi:zinc metalloprotease ZmpB